MVSGYVLIVAVLMLGGVIATLGDRIGMRVGKARLSLFNLRPRQTATVVSIATGGVISASTLALLFGVSSQLRTGVFELGRIQADLARAEAALADARSTQTEVEDDLESATRERQRALERLQEINQSLDQAIAQQDITESQLRQTQGQLQAVSQQAAALRQSTETLRVERDRLQEQQRNIQAQIAQRDRDIVALDQTIAQRDRDIAQREQLLAELEAQQGFLELQVSDLQNQYQGLFLGNIALGRNQEILSGMVRAENREQAADYMAQFLFEANRQVLQAVAPGTSRDHQAIFIGSREVERLIDRLSTGEEYLVRLLSAANYITGEPCVTQGADPCIQVFIDASPNRSVYIPGERLATIALEDPPFSDRELVERLNLLLVATQFRARQDGVVVDNLLVADNRTETLLRFLDIIKQRGQSVDLQAIAASEIYTAGPLHIDIAAVQNGRILLSTRDITALPTSERSVPSPPQSPVNP
jgi:uncharacterized protein (DUF3084 family)